MDEKDEAMLSVLREADVDDPAFIAAFDAFFPRYQAWWKDESVEDDFADSGVFALDSRFIFEPETLQDFLRVVGPCRAFEALNDGDLLRDPNDHPALHAAAVAHVKTCEKCCRILKPEDIVN